MDSKISSDKDNIEAEIVNLIDKILIKKKDSLSSVGIKTEFIGIRRKNNDEEYTSEVEINFLDSHGIFDILEFFIFYKGTQEASILEIEEWLIENVDDIINKKILKN